ncbi:MAG: glycosyltransferase family 39 protein, partial [Chthoniobacterales bacterium]|nr:glycosyltransferase family 39 protein [Chthoniobacterales bacterium]
MHGEMVKAESGARAAGGVIFAFAAVALLIHLLTNGRYGYFRDELYFLACSRHLDWGYVDMAPLSAWVLRLQTSLFGESLFSLRLLPAIAHALVVALTGWLAREMGGRAWAVGLACTASLSALVYLAIGNVYAMNVFEPLFWGGCAFLLVRIVNSSGSSGAMWLLFGLVAGLGFQNKHSFVFFGAATVLALLFTPQRRELLRLPIWMGGGIALAIALPNIVWQVQHGWPTLELLRNVAESDKNVVLGPVQFVVQQVLIMNPATLPLWLGGLLWLLVSRLGSRYRVIGLTYLFALAIFILMRGKHYYLAPIYPLLFAAGGVAWKQFTT